MQPTGHTVEALFRGLGSASHDGDMDVNEVQEALSELHPAVMGTMVRRWAEAREKSGQSSAEHPDFRRAVQGVLDRYPDGYGGL